MSEDERAKFVEAKRKERDEVLAKITAVSARRTAHLTASGPAKNDAFDSKVYDSLKKAGAKSGISY
jgi:hypothetical protein